MQNLGVKLLAVSFCCFGALLGQALREVCVAPAADWFHDRLELLVLAALGNLIGLSALVICFRRRAAEPPLESPVYVMEALIRGLPANNRVAFPLFSVAWLLGAILGMALKVQ